MAVNCHEPGCTFSALITPGAVVDHERSSAPVATE